jgi:hypothetical protein
MLRLKPHQPRRNLSAQEMTMNRPYIFPVLSEDGSKHSQ